MGRMSMPSDQPEREPSDRPGLIPRRSCASIRDALADTRVVLVNGARQAGKSTLLRLATEGIETVLRNLDIEQDRRAAEADPAGFVESAVPMIIDEVQRVPELFLSIKAEVDRDPRPGRFILSGSSRVLAMRGLPDALPGRMETIELWPLSQGEIDRTRECFVDTAFEQGPELRHESTLKRSDYAARLVRGGFPEAVRREGRRRSRFFEAYATDLITRDVVQLAEIERVREMRAMLGLIAGRSGSLLVPANLAARTGLAQTTVNRYLALLEEIFFIKRIPAWSRNISSRSVSTSKAYLVDSGIAANLLAADTETLLRPGGPIGPLLEGFVVMELARQLDWADVRADLSHYRTKDGAEVDVILEDRRGRVIGIEIKATSTVRAEDFKGLRHLAERVGDDLVAGFVLHTGPHTLPFGPKLRAVPISAIWQPSPG